jgi:adenine-specific DNA-methyltransferase
MPHQKLRPSFSFDEERIKQLKQIAPEAFADGKINWKVLQEALGDNLEEEGQEIEHFGLFWPGKREARRLAAIPSQGTLVPCPGEGVDEENTRNIFIEGENLEVLKLLQKSYAGRIKMIYIDPPYNTGNDFVYEDDFKEPIEEYLRRTGQVNEEGKNLTTNTKTDGRFHSKWLSMMYPRLRLAKNLLRDDGVIVVSIDDNEAHNLKTIMNEIFGEENFVAQVIWQKRVSPANDAKYFSSDHEYLLFYTKVLGYWFPNRTMRTAAHDQYYKNPDNDPRGPWNSAAYTCNKNKSERPNLYYPIINPYTKEKVWPDEKAVWAYSKEKHLENVQNNLLYWGKDGKSKCPRKKQFLTDAENVVPRSVWHHTEVGSTQQATLETAELFDGSSFTYPKSVKLLQKAIYQSTTKDNNDIILDFFSGSSTIAQAVIEQNKEDGGNRTVICVQLPEKCAKDTEANKAGYKTIAEIGKERVRRLILKLKKEIKGNRDLFINDKYMLDLGFKVYKLNISGFKRWRNYEGLNPEQLEAQFEEFNTPLNNNWKKRDLVSEIILLEGFPLDSKTDKMKGLDKNKVEIVTSDFCEHRLLVCLDEKIYAETAKEIQHQENDIFICLDSALTDQLKLTLADKCLLKTI